MKMDASKTERMRLLSPNLATCWLAILCENAIKFELSNEKGRENQTKTRCKWSGGHNQNKFEKCEWTLNPGVRPCGEVKNMSGSWDTILYSKLKWLVGVMYVKPAE